MGRNLFNHLDAVTKEQSSEYWKELDEQDRKTWSTFMINRYVSMDIKSISLVDLLQKYNHGLTHELAYKLYIGFLPKIYKFLRYVKKENKSKYTAEEIGLLAKYYKCSKREALQYSEILSEDAVKEIINLFEQKHKVTKRKKK